MTVFKDMRMAEFTAQAGEAINLRGLKREVNKVLEKEKNWQSENK